MNQRIARRPVPSTAPFPFAGMPVLMLVLAAACAPGSGGGGLPGGGGSGAAGAGAAAAPAGEAATGGTPEAVVFLGVNVIPMDGEEVLRNRAVAVRDGRIAEVSDTRAYDPPPDVRIVDAAGLWLLPGLAEMHAHIPTEGGPELTEQILFLYLANGITTLRGMLGEPGHLLLREAVAHGEVVGPRIYTSGPSLNGFSIPDADSARRAVLHQAEAGYDFLKIHPGLSRKLYDTIARTADSVGLAWAGHVPAEVGLERALEARQASIDHLDQYLEALVREDAENGEREPLFFGVHLVDALDLDRIPELARATARAGVWNVPTQSLIERIILPDDAGELSRLPELRYVHPRTVQAWIERRESYLSHPSWSPERARQFVEVRRKLIRALHEAGAPLLLGSDAPQVFQVPGFSLRAELAMLVEAGLSPYEALRAGTVAPARYFGEEARRGAVRPGMQADLLLLEANPLDDIGNVARVAGVMAAGHWVPASDIEPRLEAIASSHARD